jgi:cytochrome c553
MHRSACFVAGIFLLSGALAFACGGSTNTTEGGGPTNAGTDAGDGTDAGATIDDGSAGADGATGTDPNDPLNAAAKCTSNRMWTQGDRGSASMHPGVACINCHKNEPRAPTLTIAGTVYPSGHEPNDCNGAAGANVVITDANGKVTTLVTNSAGNFRTSAAIATPYTAKVTFNGKERAMQASQTVGDCNSCHTATGANNAPGRITLPY